MVTETGAITDPRLVTAEWEGERGDTYLEIGDAVRETFLLAWQLGLADGWNPLNGLEIKVDLNGGEPGLNLTVTIKLLEGEKST